MYSMTMHEIAAEQRRDMQAVAATRRQLHEIRRSRSGRPARLPLIPRAFAGVRPAAHGPVSRPAPQPRRDPVTS